ncbi:uncharacterized protein NPIL_313851 [Nephila pilipes]|uniref:Gustatory receptor n=1 Tax=Nephila pilipes TaxID=299642 RepID=A0A8X6TSY3_NEPPI|nr:uncharacterized protein NPIL_313851 [Nephila pilipes]
MVCFRHRAVYKTNIPEINLSFWIPEDHTFTRQLVTIVDTKTDIYAIYGVLSVFMIFYNICCLQLANLSLSITKIIENRNDEISFAVIQKLFSLFTDFEQLTSFPVGITILRVILEVFSILFDLIGFKFKKIGFNFSYIMILISLALVCCADFAQNSMTSLKKTLWKIILPKTDMFFQSNFNRQCLMYMECQKDAKLTAWKFFTLNRSFFLNILAFFVTYSVIMVQFEGMGRDSSGDCKICCDNPNMNKSGFASD